jgi:hypothetical protein
LRHAVVIDFKVHDSVMTRWTVWGRRFVAKRRIVEYGTSIEGLVRQLEAGHFE